MQDPFELIAERLGPGGRCLLMPNGGNLGDCLIASATIQRLDRSGMPWSLLRGQRKTLARGDVLAYGGGGSLVPLYQGGRECIESLLGLARPLELPLFVLPQSIHGHEDLWANVRNATVFCRDAASLRFMSGFGHLAALPGHDLATGLDLAAEPFSTVQAIRDAHAARGETRPLHAFRADAEAAGAPVAGSLDLSGLAHPPMTSIASIHAHAAAFLAAVATFSEIHTDRLHVAIAGGLLGIPTSLHDNRYGKNRGVFDMTLSGRFPAVRFHEGPR